MCIIVTCLLLPDYNKKNVCSGLHHKVDENCALLGYYTASIGNFLPFWDNVSIQNYLLSLRNNREEHISQQILVIQSIYQFQSYMWSDRQAW